MMDPSGDESSYSDAWGAASSQAHPPYYPYSHWDYSYQSRMCLPPMNFPPWPCTLEDMEEPEYVEIDVSQEACDSK